jgi:peptidoglycan/LPS O-acetylase OafA/YrhL
MVGRLHFSKSETNFIKGIGILMIMFHNYFHIIPPITGENEFSFSSHDFDNFISLLSSNPFSSIRYIFSYFGHYGVQLFIFLSSYGLYLSYKERELHFLKFLKKRLLKIYPALVIVVLLLLLFIIGYEAGLPEPEKLKSILLKLTLLFNFIPGEALSVSGPLWFFSLIVQLYFMFPFLLFISRKYGENVMLFMALGFVIISLLFNPFFVQHDLSLYFTFIGQLPVFCLGIYFAARPTIKISNGIILVALLLFLTGNVNEYLWHFSFAAFTILMLATFIFLIPLLKRFKKLNIFLVFTGSFSLFLFAVHGMVRYPFEAIAEKYNDSIITTLLCFVYVAGTYLFAEIIRWVESKLQALVTSDSALSRVLSRDKNMR